MIFLATLWSSVDSLRKEQGDIELLQHIACLDVRPQTRTAKKIPTEATSRTLKTSTHHNPSILEVLKHVSFKPFPSSFHESMNQNLDLPVPPSVCSSPDGPPPRLPLPTTSSPGVDRDFLGKEMGRSCMSHPFSGYP